MEWEEKQQLCPQESLLSTQIRSLLLFAGTYFKSLINTQRRKCLDWGWQEDVVPFQDRI